MVMEKVDKFDLLRKIEKAEKVGVCSGTECKPSTNQEVTRLIQNSEEKSFYYLGDLNSEFSVSIWVKYSGINRIKVLMGETIGDATPSKEFTNSELIPLVKLSIPDLNPKISNCYDPVGESKVGSEDYYLIDAFEARAKKESENYKKRVKRLRKTYDLIWFANNFFLLLSIGILWGSWYFDNKPLKYIFPGVVLVLLTTNITAVPSLLEWTDKKIASLPKPKNANQLLTAHKKEIERIKNEL